MTLKNLSETQPVGVIGAGNFGSTVANLLARHRNVLLYARDEKVVKRILEKRENRGHTMSKNITPTNDLQYLAKQCDVIFPIVPSVHRPGTGAALCPLLASPKPRRRRVLCPLRFPPADTLTPALCPD